MNSRTISRATVAVMAFGAIALTSACGGHDHASNSPVSEGARVVSVTADNLAFAPGAITATVGEPIALELTSVDIDHDLNIDEFDGHVFASAGSTATGGFTPTESGDFEFYCSIPGHREAGMEGTLSVTG